MLLPWLNSVNLHQYLEIRKGVVMNPEPHNTTTDMKVDMRVLAAVRSQAEPLLISSAPIPTSRLIVFVTNTCSYSRAVSVGSTLSLLSKLLGDQSLSTLHAHDPFITANKSEMILQARPFPSTYYVPECKIPA